ncbi:MAG: WGR domain-containing protein [Alistipes sp.]|nr:WGR domain-containing protein [Alistipes sp.]
MKRSFVKPAKKNPKFWEIAVDGKSYTITEGQTDLSSETTTKDFADADKCLKAAVKLIEKTREKGFVETLPEYSEWPGERRDYAIWRNTAAIEFIIRTVKANSTESKAASMRDPEEKIKLASESLDGILAKAAELEIYIDSEQIKIRKMAQGKDFYGIDFNNKAKLFEVWYDYWKQGCDAFRFWMNDENSSKAIIDYFVDNGIGKWFGAEEKQKTKDKDAESEIERQEKIIAKIHRVVNGQFKKDFPRLAIQLSMDFDTHSTVYASEEEIQREIAAVIFDCAKSKVKKNREETLCKTYYMLYNVKRQLPLARVRQALDELANGKVPDVESLYKDMVFEPWEKPESLPTFAIASPENKNDILKTAKHIAENADAYILQTRCLNRYIEVRNKADKGEVLDETKFFELTASSPELEEPLAHFVGKLAEYNKEYPTVFTYAGSSSQTPIPVGATAAAALALLGGTKHDALIAAYLHTIKELGWYRVSCSTMRNLWREHNATPDVPQTIAVMWKAE